MALPRIPLMALFVGLGLLHPADAAISSSDQLQGLLNRSPFGNSGTNGEASTASQQPIEFRGVLEENGTTLFSIYDSSTRRSSWVQLGEATDGLAVKTYDDQEQSVTLEYQGRLLRLPLQRSAKVHSTTLRTASKPAAAPVVPASAAQGSEAPKSGKGPYDPAEYQRRLQEQRRLRQASEPSARLSSGH